MLNETIAAGLNDPNCAFFVGSFTGSFLSLKYLLIVLFMYVLIKGLDKLAVDPIIERIKNWRKGGKKDETHT